MVKKIIFLIIVLALAIGGSFYWQKNQADVRELNKTLPEGVRVVKSLFGQEYRIVNRIDNYEFKVPKEWKGIVGVEYIPEREEMGFRGTSMNIEGLGGEARGMGIDRFRVEESSNLIDWAKNMFDVVGLTGEFIAETVGDFEAVKIQENVHLGGMFMYFFIKNNAVYTIVNGSEEFIKEIISNGKW